MEMIKKRDTSPTAGSVPVFSSRLQLIVCDSAFNRTDRTVSVIDLLPAQTLLDLRNAHFPASVPVVVSLNGKVVPQGELAKRTPAEGDQLLFVPELQDGGDSKGVLRILAMIAVTAIAWYVAPALLMGDMAYLGLGAALVAGGAVSGIGLALTAGAIVMVGGMVVNALLPPPKPQTSETSVSPSYGWSPSTIQQQGAVVPRVYGTCKCYGNIIAGRIVYNQDRQIINMLVSLGLGPVSRIYNFKVNDQSIGAFSGVKVDVRKGRLDQTTIERFEDTPAQHLFSTKVTYGNPHTFTTTAGDFGGIEAIVSCPGGIWHLDDNNEPGPYSVDVKVELSEAGQNDWVALSHQIVTVPKTVHFKGWSAGFWTTSLDGSGQNNTWVTIEWAPSPPATQSDHYEGEPYAGAGYEEQNPYWRWTDDIITYTEDAIVDYITISGDKPKPIVRTFRKDGLSGNYDIRVSKLTQESPDTDDRCEDVYFSGVTEWHTDDFQYPRHALVSLRALATDQLSGSLRFSCMVDGALVAVYDGANWSFEHSDNPAWVCYDILTQPLLDNNDSVLRYDGINPSLIDYAAFKEWADWCDELVSDGNGGTEKRCTFNGQFDAEASMWGAALQVCQAGRAMLVPRGLKYSVVVDKAASPVQLFTVGNIGIDSFTETFLPMEERATEIEVDFINKSKNHERDKLTVALHDSDGTYRTNIQLFGVTSPGEVYRATLYRLYNNLYLTRSVEIDADVDAIACAVGDVVNVQHDVPQWGFGGRITAATINTVTLDREVTIEDGKYYGIMVRLNDDSLVERNIFMSPGSHTVITVAVDFPSVPDAYCLYSFGEISKVVKPFRVMSMSVSQEQKVSLSLVEYNATIYNVDTEEPVLPTDNYSSLVFIAHAFALTAREQLFRQGTGFASRIDLSWEVPGTFSYGGAEIWYRQQLADGTSSPWTFGGKAADQSFSLRDGIKDGSTYFIRVVAMNTMGNKADFSSAPEVSVAVLGKLAPPADVTDFWATAGMGGLTLSWSAVADIDLDIYKLRFTLDTASGTWENAMDLAETKATNKTFPAAMSGMYLIKAIDTSGIESVNAKSFITTIPDIVNFNAQATLTEHTAFSGTKTAMVVASDTLRLDTDELEGFYEPSTVVDLGSVQTARCSGAVKYLGVNLEDAFDDITDIDAIDNWDGTITGVGVELLIALSQDGTNYGDWQPFLIGDFSARKFKFKLRVYADAVTKNVWVSELTFNVDMPDRMELGRGVSIAAGGTGITFGKAYMATPMVKVSVTDAVAGDTIILSSMSTTGFTVQVKDSGGTGQARTIDWESAGY